MRQRNNVTYRVTGGDVTRTPPVGGRVPWRYVTGVIVGAVICLAFTALTYWQEEPAALVPDPYLEGLR
jgi:hypothetical protein